MNEPIDEVYLIWLYSLVGSVKTRSRSKSYWALMRKLYTTEFVWFIPNDDNRIEDGRDLRYEFILETDLQDVDQDWLEFGCSVLEMLVSVARRLSFETESPTKAWFWHLLENLQLHDYNDARELNVDLVDEILTRLVWRTYLPNGMGGLFPLKRPEQDQTQIEIWYQLCAYVLENN